MTVNTATTPATRRMLWAGVIGGPLFVGAVVIQELTRAGFDPKEHALSQLSTGDLGWIQITNFILSGLLFVAAAVGMRRVLHPGRGGTATQRPGRLTAGSAPLRPLAASKWGPWLIGIFGAALIWGGVFAADPANGFPPGTPDGAPDELSWHGALHIVAPTLAGIAIVAACFVFARRFAGLGQRGWLWYSVATPVVYLVLGFASFPAEDFRLMLAGGVLAWLWASVISARLLREAG